VSFWSSLVVEVLGGIATALALGGAAAWFAASQQIRRHDEQVADLLEDNRRWFRDRNAKVEVDTRRVTTELAAQGQLHSGAMRRARHRVKRQALHEYRDEISAKRRRYRALRTAEGRWHALLRRRRRTLFPRLQLTNQEREMLAAWRVFSDPGESGETHPVDDPTSEQLEPDLRRFEREGDGCA
jgi:hypothetical protein